MSKPNIPPQTRPPTPQVSGNVNADASMSAYAASRSGAPTRRGSAGGPVFSPYSSPFDDLSSLDIPGDIKGVMRACDHLAKWSPVHSAFVQMMSTVPVTEVILKPRQEASDPLRTIGRARASQGAPTESNNIQRLNELTKMHWNLRRANQAAARSYWTYSNAVAVISYPFQKRLKCMHCGHTAPAISSTWELRNRGQFWWKCPKCGSRGRADVWDQFLPSPEDVRLIVMDVQHCDALYNPWRDEVDIFYRIPDPLVERLKSNPLDKEFVCTTPQAYLEAALGGVKFPSFRETEPRVKLRKGQYYLMRSNNLPETYAGWAFPEMAATMHDYWLHRLMQKGQEAIFGEMAIPKRFLYPSSRGSGQSLYEMINVSTYMDVIRSEYAKMRQDHGYVGVVPFPIDQVIIGGEAKSVDLSSNLKMQAEFEAAGLKVPIEAIFGGLQYSGASVSIQQMGARADDFRGNLLNMNIWFYDHVCTTFSMPMPVVEHAKFRLGEDVPYIQLLMSLVQSQVLSPNSVLELLGKDMEAEQSAIKEYTRFQNEVAEIRSKVDVDAQGQMALRQAQVQGSGQVSMMEAQMDAQIELQKKVRGDADLYQLVLQNQDMAATIFGPNSPEANQAAAMMSPQAMQMQAMQMASQQERTPQMSEPQLQSFISGFPEIYAGMGPTAGEIGDRAELQNQLARAAVENSGDDYAPPGPTADSLH